MTDIKKLPYSEDYCCPKCGAECPDEEYFVDGQKYPKYYNQTTSFYGDLDWDEVHKCQKCKTMYYFSNGD